MGFRYPRFYDQIEMLIKINLWIKLCHPVGVGKRVYPAPFYNNATPFGISNIPQSRRDEIILAKPFDD
jgi:hypothetical protein